MKETKKNGNFISYEKLLKNYLWCRDFTLAWLKDEVESAPIVDRK